MYSFNDDKMKNRLPSEMYKRFKASLKNKTPVEPEVADCIAHAMKEWALSHGATHYSHWFQPLTGWTAEKHDSFIKPNGGSNVLTEFKGKTLIAGETDGSSFPNGGLRPTECARGYTIWDPQTPAFLNMEGGVPTLCLPSLFSSYHGHALDRKIPLLRSATALDIAGKKFFAALDEHDITEVFTDSGVEQEFFIVKREHLNKRMDLLIAGRTLQGSHPPKTQQLGDHYFAPMPSTAVKFIHSVERALWKLGIPLTTRHQEVAPNQFEWAPVFSRSGIASDQNMLAMEVMRRIGENSGLAVLLHEKPFSRVNGSGKHNNWSIGTNKIPTIFAPGDKPEDNVVFLLAVATLLRSVDTHQDLFRWATSGASNDHRLGGHEAPPAIFSVYLGDYIGAIVKALIDGEPVPKPTFPAQEQHIPYLPSRKLDDSDRNRTSPVAFTGNKFELRCVGSSQAPAFSNFVLNVTSCESFEFFADEIEALKKKGIPTHDAAKQVAVEAFRKHYRIVNNGDGYAKSWPAEAEARGLLNCRTTPDALDAVSNSKTQKLLEKYNVLSKSEFEAHVLVDYTKYAQTILLEAGTLKNMSNKAILPATLRWQNAILVNADCVPSGMKQTLQTTIHKAYERTLDLEKKELALADMEGRVAARYAVDVVVPAMTLLRESLDKLEDIVDQRFWPHPGYEEILLTRHVATTPTHIE